MKGALGAMVAAALIAGLWPASVSAQSDPRIGLGAGCSTGALWPAELSAKTWVIAGKTTTR